MSVKVNSDQGDIWWGQHMSYIIPSFIWTFSVAHNVVYEIVIYLTLQQKIYIDHIIGGKYIDRDLLKDMEDDLKELRETTFKKRERKLYKKSNRSKEINFSR